MKIVAYHSQSVDESLEKLHKMFLKHNEHDEGDLIFYRIDYRLAEILKVTADEARAYHQIYHTINPRTVSKAYCSNCNQIISRV
jgi:NADH:ubiquinone oxidoreductase subunit E